MANKLSGTTEIMAELVRCKTFASDFAQITHASVKSEGETSARAALAQEHPQIPSSQALVLYQPNNRSDNIVNAQAWDLWDLWTERAMASMLHTLCLYNDVRTLEGVTNAIKHVATLLS